MVFVLDKHKKPLMPCSPKRARLLLARRRAVVHRLSPFVIRLKDRRVEESTLQPAILKIDPGIEYQRGERAGWETRAYLLEKFEHRCAYCGKGDVPFELDHQLPRSRGGSQRVSNLVLACHDCNLAKGNRTAAEFGHPEVEAQAKVPLRHAAAVNATRLALVRELEKLGLPIGSWSGGRTRWNRARFGLPKTHALDALCVGDLAGVDAGRLKTVAIAATGRGRYGRTLLDAYGFPRGYLMRRKRVQGIQTGDLILAMVPDSLKARGIHKGRIAVRASGSFRMGKVDSIPARCCRVLQRADSYSYACV